MTLLQKKDDFLVKIAHIVAPHGVRGCVRVLLFSDDIKKYKTLYNEDAQAINFKIKKYETNNTAICSLENINSRNEAEKIIDKSLYVYRSEINQQLSSKNDFLICDLIGEDLYVQNTNIVCKILSVQNYGAGDLIEVCHKNDIKFLVPFNKHNFPESTANNNENHSKIYISLDAFEAYQ